MRWAARDPVWGGDDRPSLTLNRLVEGSVIILDLDRFGELVEERGLSEYRPNVVTGTLTELVERFVRRHGGVVVYGLDYERGTEEAVIEVPFAEPEELVGELEEIRRRIRELGASITIVVVKDYVVARPARTRREAYTATPGRRRAARLLRAAKRRGGDVVVVG